MIQFSVYNHALLLRQTQLQLLGLILQCLTTTNWEFSIIWNQDLLFILTALSFFLCGYVCKCAQMFLPTSIIIKDILYIFLKTE